MLISLYGAFCPTGIWEDTVPSNALLQDDGSPIINDDGSYILIDEG